MIALRIMTEDEYNNWVKYSISDYAKNLFKAEKYSETEAIKQAEKEFYSLLKNGLDTPGHHLFVAENDNKIPVGVIWYITADANCIFIADFLVYEEYRRMGYGIAILTKLERKVKPEGFSMIKLHVFRHNIPAIKLYEKCGFVPIKGDGDLYMEKQI